MNELRSEIRDTLLALGPATFGAISADIVHRVATGQLMFVGEYSDLGGSLFEEWQTLLRLQQIEPAGEGRAAWVPVFNVGMSSGEGMARFVI